MSNQIVTYPSNSPQSAFYPVNSRSVYDCANAFISRGATVAPQSLQDCLQKFKGVRDVAEAIGFFNPSSALFGASGEYVSGGYTLWQGLTQAPGNTSGPLDMYFPTGSDECNQIQSILGGNSWFGCLWGTPSAPYSCTCPDTGDRYEAYIKHRLNVASFWNTPVETPVKRAEFVDALQYGRKIDVTIAGDFNLKVGQVVNIRLDGISGFPYASKNHYLNGLYYITGIKHVVTNSGTHETALALSSIALDYTTKSGLGSTAAPYYS